MLEKQDTKEQNDSIEFMEALIIKTQEEFTFLLNNADIDAFIIEYLF